MKKIAISLLLVISGVVAAESSEEFLSKKVDSWFAEAKPATKGVFVTDAKGCLFSVYDPGNGIQVIPMLDETKKPSCRK